jgi:outer membrane protein
MFATLYKEIQVMVARIAQWKHYTYVLRVSNDPITGSDPRSALAAIDRTIVYAEPVNDITEEVVTYLNKEYQAKGGPAPKAAMNPKANPN